MPQIVLDSIKCKQTSESPYKDEVYLYITVDGSSVSRQRYPQGGYNSMDAGETWEIGLTISYISSVRIDIMDEDDVSNDDYLGTANYTPDTPVQPAVVSTYNADNGAKYEVYTH